MRRDGQQVEQQVLGRGALAFLVLAVGVEQPEPLGAGDLVGQHAPGVPQPARLAGRPLDLHALLHVELVEAQGHDLGPGRLHADVLDELVDGGQVGQVRRVADQVQQGDQRVRLAAAVGQLQLPHGLVVLAGEAVDDILGQFAEVVGREGQGEELGRLAVDLAAPVHDHVV